MRFRGTPISRPTSLRWPLGVFATLVSGAFLVAGAAPAAAAPPVATTTAVTLSSAAAHPYQPFTVTAKITPASAATVTGNVTFTRAGSTLCSAVAVTAGSASCTAHATATSSASPVTATYTPSDGVTTGSTGNSPALSVVTYPVTLKATYTAAATSTCTHRVVTVTVTRAKVTPAPSSGLPTPTGTVTVVASKHRASGPLAKNGTFTTCLAVSGGAPTVSYGGDADYATATVTAVKSSGSAACPNHTRTGACPNHTRTGVIVGGSGEGGGSVPSLAGTGPSHVGGLLITGGSLLLVGLALLLGARRRRTA